MPQFLVRTYDGRDGAVRVVVDGIGELDVPDRARVEAEAAATILAYLRSLLPPRPYPTLGPDCRGAFGFDVELCRSAAGDGPPPALEGGEGHGSVGASRGPDGDRPNARPRGRRGRPG